MPQSEATDPPVSAPEPLFTMFYIEHPSPVSPMPPSASGDSRTYIVPPPLSPVSPLPDTLDDAASNAEAAFWEVMRALGHNDAEESKDSEESKDGKESEESGGKVRGFWPTDDVGDGSDEED